MFKVSLLFISAFALFADTAKFEETLYDEWGQTFVIDREILHKKTEHQDLMIFENSRFGTVLTLDGVIQLTEADEPIYHEMMAHVPLLAHDNPASVLIVGGGDGGMLREVLRHSSVKRVVLVDIDRSVIEMSKKYFPKLSSGAFDDPRVEVVIQDAAEYVQASTELFDVIIGDSTDPIGPGEALFTSDFYGHCKKRLRPDGIFVNQNGVPSLQNTELVLTFKNRSPHFKYVGFYVAPVPTYVGGFMAFGWASDRDYQVPEEVLQKRCRAVRGSFFYYTPQIHKASFALPSYMLKQLSNSGELPVPVKDP